MPPQVVPKPEKTDFELAELADWAEQHEKDELDDKTRRAYGAIRQGMDWLIRLRIQKKQRELQAAGNTRPADESDKRKM